MSAEIKVHTQCPQLASISAVSAAVLQAGPGLHLALNHELMPFSLSRCL